MDPRAGLDILEKRKTLTLTRIQTLDHEACSLVTILTMISSLMKYYYLESYQRETFSLLPWSRRRCSFFNLMPSQYNHIPFYVRRK